MCPAGPVSIQAEGVTLTESDIILGPINNFSTFDRALCADLIALGRIRNKVQNSRDDSYHVHTRVREASSFVCESSWISKRLTFLIK